MQKITPFLWFDGQAEEAMNFYTSIFRYSKVGSVSRYGDAGPGPKGSVMSATFEIEGQQFHALNGGPEFKFTPAISFLRRLQDAGRSRRVLSGTSSPRAGRRTSAAGSPTSSVSRGRLIPTVLGEMFRTRILRAQPA